MELVGSVTKSNHGEDQANPAEDDVSLHGNTRRTPQQIQIRPAVVLTRAETPSPPAVLRSPSASPQKCSTALSAHKACLGIVCPPQSCHTRCIRNKVWILVRDAEMGEWLLCHIT